MTIPLDPNSRPKMVASDSSALLSTAVFAQESGSPLIEAIKARNEEDVEILAPTCSKDEINAEIELGNRPIHLAAAKGLERAVRALLAAGADGSAPNAAGKSPFLLCLESHYSPGVLKMLVEAGHAHVDTQSEREGTALLYAAWRRDLKTVMWFLDHGASPTFVHHKWGSALHCSARDGTTLIMSALLEKGAKADIVYESNLIQAPDGHHRLPIHEAIVNGHTQAISILLQHGSPVDSVPSSVSKMPSPLLTLVKHTPVGARDEILRMLVRHGADLSVRDGDGRSILFHLPEISYHAQTDLVELLLDKGCDANAVDKTGKSVVCFYAANGAGDSLSVEFFEKLVDAKVNLSLPDASGRFPLDYLLQRAKKAREAEDSIQEEVLRDLVDYFKGQGANSSVSYGSMDKPRWSMNNMEGHPHAVHGLPNGKGKGEHGAQCAPPGACCIM